MQTYSTIRACLGRPAEAENENLFEGMEGNIRVPENHFAKRVLQGKQTGGSCKGKQCVDFNFC
jgi:hypothetical protein